MKFFIDSADIQEIRTANLRGWVDGVTTNPSLVAKSGKDFHTVIKEICAEIKGPVSAEVLSLESEKMVQEGRVLAKIADNVVVKIPMTEEGLIAVRKLTSDGIKTNVTLVFSPVQALMIAKAGATMVSPFVGRLDDVGQNGLDLIAQIVQIYRNYSFRTEVLVASVRHPIHLIESAMLGADIATIPFKVMQQFCQHPLTDKGLKIFLEDWNKSQKK
ncbi:MAG: fructose-6-phosphate aldolase [Bdellovibrio sp.]|nr:MAG: fructose-6-phosphate aldolase [Bdellovibrio sp.]